MAINKRKVLDAARRYVQKGARAKAFKEYGKLLASDPQDAKLLLEVGDTYRRWGEVEEAIAHMNKLVEFRPHCIEEPIARDDVLRNLSISEALAPHGIGVACGEQVPSPVVFKQLLKAGPSSSARSTPPALQE